MAGKEIVMKLKEITAGDVWAASDRSFTYATGQLRMFIQDICF